ncbi:hypothetical protein, partial [Vibrio harveyi]|uniref:hypothetical protein n=1 Tax=Vibrio harveyi TaxID=669 RepID=UPI001A7ECCFA
SSKNSPFRIKNTQTIKKSKKTRKRACQCDRNLYNATSLTRQRFERNEVKLASQLAERKRLIKSLKKVIDTKL